MTLISLQVYVDIRFQMSIWVLVWWIGLFGGLEVGFCVTWPVIAENIFLM